MGCIDSIFDYFDKRKALAMGLYFTGQSISLFLWPPIVSVLFNYYGWRGTFMILAGFMLHGCLVGALMRPFKGMDKTNRVKERKSVCPGLKSQVKVFKNKYWVVFCAAFLMVMFGIQFMQTYLPTMAEGHASSGTDAAFLVSIFGK